MITFIDTSRQTDREFTVTRGLRGRAILPGGLASNGEASETVTQVRVPTRNWADDNEWLSSGEREELLDSSGSGITVSGEDGLDFGIIGRTHHLDGPFATPTSSLTIKNAEGFPAVTLVEARIKSLFGSDSRWVITLVRCCLYSLAA